MEIGKLYEEYGASMAKQARNRRDYIRSRDALYSNRQAIDDKLDTLKEGFRNTADSISKRNDILAEAIRLAEDEQMDPLLAKLTAEVQEPVEVDEDDEEEDLDDCFWDEEEDDEPAF